MTPGAIPARVYKRKTQRAALPVSWDLAIWPKRGAEKTSVEKAGVLRTTPGSRSRLELFEELILPHLNAAHNLARWLTRDDQDAQDVVQESYLRAFRFFDTYKGGDEKAWLLTIVRNTCRTWQRRHNRAAAVVPFDEVEHSHDVHATNQEQNVVDIERIRVLRECMENLPADFREVLVMRELEEMSYQEIATVTNLPPGTVMSRLSRARKRLEECVARRIRQVAT